MELVTGDQVQPNVEAGEKGLMLKLDHLAMTAARDLGADGVLMSVLHNEKFFSLGAYPSRHTRLSDREHNAKDTVCMHTVTRGTPLQVNDARSDMTLRSLKYVQEGEIVGYLGIPIVSAQFGKIGAVCSITHEPRNWENMEESYLQQVANNAELLLLQEMGRLELKSLYENYSDVDRIVATLSSSTTVPTSIYELNGSLVFANKALMGNVPEEVVANFWHSRRQEIAGRSQPSVQTASGKYLGDTQVSVVTVSGGKDRFNVSSVVANSGLICCSWSKILVAVG